MLKGKHIILGITGSIAAYKAAYIIRALVKKGAEVQVVIVSFSLTVTVRGTAMLIWDCGQMPC